VLSHAQPLPALTTPTTTHPAPRTAPRTAALLALLVSLFASLLLGATPTAAHAATPGTAAVREASRHNGQPYAYGATGPTRFDCSGFTLYVFSRFGRRLPHSSAAQYNAAGVRHIAKTSKQPGDLIFIRNSSGRIYHVGVYAGNGKFWHSPKSGDHVRLAAIYSSNYVVGRLS
jgi:cell wall-associated NlpC family hydrolase